MIKDEIIQLIKKALEELGISSDGVMLEHPGEEGHGDYSSNVAMQLFKEYKTKLKLKSYRSPRELAEKIVNSIPKNDIIEKVEVAGPGFINFYLSESLLLTSIDKVLSEKDEYGKSEIFKEKKFMVEFAHPNTHKMFHIGHLRNITTGEAIVRILEANGAKVIRANYEGDVGMHIAKCMYAILRNVNEKFNNIEELKDEFKTIKERVEFLGKMYTEGNRLYESNEESKRAIEDLNKKIYNKDPDIFNLWKETRQWSLDYFETIYKRVNSNFDRYYFESEVFKRGKEIVLEFLKKGIFKESEGAVIFPGEKFKLHNRVFITSDGNPTYEGKDMGLGELQFKEYDPDLIIHVVSSEQAGYFQVIFEALAQIFPETRGREKHLIYGWVNLKSGKMSSRTGNVILGEWLLDEAKKRIDEIMGKVVKGKGYSSSETESLNSIKDKFSPDGSDNNNIPDVLEKVAVSSVKYSFLKMEIKSDISFDFEESIDFDGDSGPYIQYVYARTKSIERNAGDYSSSKARSVMTFKDKISPDGSNNRFNPEEISILRWIYRFPEIIEEAGKRFAPNAICSYLFELAKRYNLFYNKLPILKAESEEMRDFRIMLNTAVGQVIKNGLEILGIETVERM